MECHHPRIGVSVLIERDGKVLLGKRRGSTGEGTWAFPGGKLDFGESLDACAVREAREETGLSTSVCSPSLIAHSSDIIAGVHWITICVQACAEFGEPRVIEPEKCEQWVWFAWDALPVALFAPTASAIRTVRGEHSEKRVAVTTSV